MPNPLLLKLAEYVSAVPDTEDISPASAKMFLRDRCDDNRCAAVLYTAARCAYSLDMLSWEPETLWLTMEKDNIDLSVVCRDKLQAALALNINPQYYWDSIVFENTVQAFEGNLSNWETIQECHPVEMSRTAYEAEIIRGMDPEGKGGDTEYDEDVQQYTAVCLDRAGYVVAPEQLSYADESLAQLLPASAMALRSQTKKKWDKLDKENLETTTFEESLIDISLSRLAGVYLTVEDYAKSIGQDFLTFKAI